MTLKQVLVEILAPPVVASVMHHVKAKHPERETLVD